MRLLVRALFAIFSQYWLHLDKSSPHTNGREDLSLHSEGNKTPTPEDAAESKDRSQEIARG